MHADQLTPQSTDDRHASHVRPRPQPPGLGRARPSAGGLHPAGARRRFRTATFGRRSPRLARSIDRRPAGPLPGGRRGKPSALYAAAGAKVTVVDISGEMLALDRQVAAERQLDITCIQASMDDLAGLARGRVRHRDPTGQHLLRARPRPGLSRGGPRHGCRRTLHQPAQTTLELASFDRADFRRLRAGRTLLPHAARCPRSSAARTVNPARSNSCTAGKRLLGGMCRAGFSIEDLIEPLHADEEAAIGTFGHRSRFVPPYVRIKARRIGSAGDSQAPSPRVWLPS